MRGGGSVNRSDSANLARAKSITAVGLDRIFAANASSHPFHSADPRMVMALGCVATGCLDKLAARLVVGFLATFIPSKTEPWSGLSIDGARAVGKPGIGGIDTVSMSPVYARRYTWSSLAGSVH
jgi:hypothetical protein